MSDQKRKVEHVVVDSGGFIKNAPIQSIGENIYSIRDVVNEIRDRATRQRLQVLPYKIIFREPQPEAIKIVTDFSKKTGDYKTLSAIDIRLLALTYQLEKEHVGTEHIKTAPERKIVWNTTKRNLENPTEIAGFYLKKNKSHTASERTSISEQVSSDTHWNKETDTSPETWESDNFNTTNNTDDRTDPCYKPEVNRPNIEDAESSDTNNQKSSSVIPDGAAIPEDCLERLSSDEDSDDCDDDDDGDDDEGWITPGNIKAVRARLGESEAVHAAVPVGCLTTDFSMQNVLIQMGLNIISVDGMLILQAKSYVQRCFACMKITNNMAVEFCPHCGNSTLQRISMSVEDDGTVRYFLSRRKQTSTRGLKFSLPRPRGGKHASNPILVADQPQAHQRVTKKSRQKFDALNTDYVANTSPFSTTDVTSKAAQLGIRGHRNDRWDQRNPNEGRRRHGRRK